MTKALVTGGTGFIGSNLVAALLDAGCQVRAFDNNFRGLTENLKEHIARVELVQGDIRDPRSVSEAARGCDHVYHLAFINGTEFFYTKPELVMDVGIRGHFNVLDACIRHDVSLFVYASSSEIYQTPAVIPTPEDVPGIVPDVSNPRYSYGGSKLIGELLTLHYAGKTTMKRIIFRPHNIYGPAMGFEHVIPQIVGKIFKASGALQEEAAQITIQGTGEETRAFCYIEDAVRGILTAAEKGQNEHVYHVGSEQETPIRELVESIAGILGVKLTIAAGELQQGSTPRRCPDISKLKALGYRPTVSLQEGLRRTVNWYRRYYTRKEISPA